MLIFKANFCRISAKAYATKHEQRYNMHIHMLKALIESMWQSRITE